jgi:hypothetical protein
LGESDGGGVKFTKSDVERREAGLILDSFGVDEKAAVVLGFEKFVVVAIGVGGVVEKDDPEAPTQSSFLSLFSAFRTLFHKT